MKFWLLISALALMIVMLARPQMGSKISNDKRNGIETIIALDISNSMLAQDVVPSRLEKSKMLVESLVDNFTNDKIGLVVFAGDAFVQLPITNDYVSAKMFLHDISPSLITTQGTDLARAINLSASSFTQQHPATGVRPPLLMFVIVLAIAPVAGIPPKIGVTIFATPSAINSVFELWFFRASPSAADSFPFG